MDLKRAGGKKLKTENTAHNVSSCYLSSAGLNSYRVIYRQREHARVSSTLKKVLISTGEPIRVYLYIYTDIDMCVYAPRMELKNGANSLGKGV